MDNWAFHSRRMGFLADLAAVFLGFVIADESLRLFDGHPPIISQSVYFRTFIFCVITWMLALFLASKYPSRRSSTLIQEIGIALRVNVVGLLMFGFVAFVIKAIGFSRLFMADYFMTVFVIMALVRIVTRGVLGTARRAGWDVRSRILIGTGLAARQYIDDVESNLDSGLRILGYVASLDTTGSLPLPFLGDIRHIDTILAEHPVQGVVITLPVTHPNLESVIRACDTQGIEVELALDGLWSRIASSDIIHGIGGSRLVLAAIPHSTIALVWKRATDILISAFALLVFSPIFLAVAIAIKLDDGGPVFFSQERVGQHKRIFRMHKFRSMRTDAEVLREKLLHLNEMSGPVFKLKNDPRVTRVGQFLRRTSLDELPQFWNVLVGDMSLVGPRPPLPREVKEYEHEQRRRLSVKPGLTCLWQISGRNDVDFEEWMQLDLAYIDNWSYFEDWKILLKTVPAVLRRHGAS